MRDSAWSLKGNANTDSSTNFIGTTDDQPLMFRTNTVSRMKLRLDGGLELFGEQSMTAVGYQALSNNTGGANTAIGQTHCNTTLQVNTIPLSVPGHWLATLQDITIRLSVPGHWLAPTGFL